MNSNGKYGDLIIKIICREEKEKEKDSDSENNYTQFNNIDLLMIKNVSLGEYLYGGKIKFNYFDNKPIELEYKSCLDNISILCVKGKGLPIVKDISSNIDSNIDSNIERGDLYIQLKIKNINSIINNDNDRINYEKTKELILHNH